MIMRMIRLEIWNPCRLEEEKLERTTLRSRNGLADRITYATGEAVRNEYNSEEQLAAQYLITADGREKNCLKIRMTAVEKLQGTKIFAVE